MLSYNYPIISSITSIISSIILSLRLSYTSNSLLLSRVLFFVIDTLLIILNYSLNTIFFDL